MDPGLNAMPTADTIKLEPAQLGRRRLDRLASRAQVADYLDVPEATLTAWAYRKTGPRYRIIGRHARYSWADVERWIAAQESGGGAA